MYRSAAEALVRLIEKEGPSGYSITSMQSEVTRLANGIRYFALEVTCAGGAQYGISAFDEEAEELHSAALSLRQAQELPQIISR